MLTSNKGSVQISNQAIAKIVSLSIREVREVTALADGWTKRTDRNKFYKAILIDINDMGLAINVNPIVRLGIPLHQLSRSLQLKIKQEVEKMTGLIVTAVNINIAGTA